MRKERLNGQTEIIVPASFGVMISATVSIVLIGIVTTMIQKESEQIEYLKYICPCIHMVALFAGSLCSGMISKNKMLLTIAIVFAVNYLSIIGTTILAFNGMFEGFLASITAGILGAVAALLVCTKKEKKAKIKFRKAKIC